MSQHQLGGLRLFLLSVCMAATPGAPAAVASDELPPLRLESMGVFFVGGKSVDSPYSDQRDATFPTQGRSTVIGQAKITFLLPEQQLGPAMVLVPGAGLSSSIYLATPDGREGWAQYFARHGHPVYVVDLPDRSSAGFSIDTVNGCMQGDSRYSCDGIALGKTSLEQPWSVWGFGPEFGQLFDDSRFPALPLQERYVEQVGAAFEVFTGAGFGSGSGGDSGAAATALELLLEAKGPAVLVVHSAAGAPGFALAGKRPDLVHAVVAVETVACPVGKGAAVHPLGTTPLLALYGDHVEERTAGNHRGRHAACKQAATELAALNTPARFIDLPVDLQVYGNSHLMMQDNNSDDIAALIRNWLQSIPQKQ